MLYAYALVGKMSIENMDVEKIVDGKKSRRLVNRAFEK